MTIFELVKLALDELYEEAKEEFGAQSDAEIKNKLSYLSDSYNRLGQASRKVVNYKDPATRFAYVYKYVSAHADYLVQVMETCKASGGDWVDEKAGPTSCALEPSARRPSTLHAVAAFSSTQSPKLPAIKIGNTAAPSAARAPARR